MKLEELTQDELDILLARSNQRVMLISIITAMMECTANDNEALAMKRGVMASISLGISMGGFFVGDNLDKEMLKVMRDHCEQEIAMEDLLNSTNL
jgi:hypothetical protein